MGGASGSSTSRYNLNENSNLSIFLQSSPSYAGAVNWYFDPGNFFRASMNVVADGIQHGIFYIKGYT